MKETGYHLIIFAVPAKSAGRTSRQSLAVRGLARISDYEGQA
jgi:hypothetical protein